TTGEVGEGRELTGVKAGTGAAIVPAAFGADTSFALDSGHVSIALDHNALVTCGRRRIGPAGEAIFAVGGAEDSRPLGSGPDSVLGAPIQSPRNFSHAMPLRASAGLANIRKHVDILLAAGFTEEIYHSRHSLPMGDHRTPLPQLAEILTGLTAQARKATSASHAF